MGVFYNPTRFSFANGTLTEIFPWIHIFRDMLHEKKAKIKVK